MNTPMTFENALLTWKLAATRAATAKADYLQKFSAELLASAAKNAEGRKAEADIASAKEKLALDLAEVEERAAYHQMIHLRAPGYVAEAA